MKAQLRWVTKFLAGLVFVLIQLGGQPAHGETPIQSGETRPGDIAASQMDMWTFEGTEGDRVLIDADWTSGNYFDTEILLIDPDYLDENSTQPGGDLLDHVLLKTGLYTIVVQDSGLNHNGNYNITLLNLTAGPMTSVDDLDGGPIASGETRNGYIAVSDMDAYQFYGEAGDRVLIDADWTSGNYFDTEILLIDPDYLDENSTQPGGDLLDHVLLKTGLYTIVVQDSGLNHNGNYNITLMRLPGAASFPGDCDGGPIAPVPPDNTRNGYIAVSDMDAYQFYGEAGDRVLIDADWTSGNYFNTEILLIDPDYLDEADTKPGGDLLDHILLNTGLYTIVVQDSGLNHNGSYNITLHKLPSTLRPGIYDPDPATACDQLSEVTLTWYPVSAATGYDVFFGIDVIEPLVLVCSDVPNPSCTVSGLDESAVYYWKVVAHTAGAEIQGTVNWFVTEVLCDLNHDCGCDMKDWLLFGEDWGRTDCNDPGTESCECDLNNDGSCDMQDWLLFGQHWGWTFCP